MMSTDELLDKVIEIAEAESFKAPQSVEHPWDRGYRAGAAAVAQKLKDLRDQK